MPWSNPGPAKQVVIAGPAGELLVYSPTVGAGNLIMAEAGSAGVDPYGNAYPAGLSFPAQKSHGGNADLISWAIRAGSTLPNPPYLAYFINQLTFVDDLEMFGPGQNAGLILEQLSAQFGIAFGSGGGEVSFSPSGGGNNPGSNQVALAANGALATDGIELDTVAGDIQLLQGGKIQLGTLTTTKFSHLEFLQLPFTILSGGNAVIVNHTWANAWPAGTNPTCLHSVQVGSNLDFLSNVQSESNTAVTFRVFTKTGGNVGSNSSGTLHVLALG